MKKLDKNVLLETNVEEERRLLYVAMTRAEERLYIYQGHKDSKFIKELKDRKQVVSKIAKNQNSRELKNRHIRMSDKDRKKLENFLKTGKF